MVLESSFFSLLGMGFQEVAMGSGLSGLGYPPFLVSSALRFFQRHLRRFHPRPLPPAPGDSDHNTSGYLV